MRIQDAKIDPVIGSGSEDLTTSSSGEATLSIRLKLSYLVEDCNLSPASAMVDAMGIARLLDEEQPGNNV